MPKIILVVVGDIENQFNENAFRNLELKSQELMELIENHTSNLDDIKAVHCFDIEKIFNQTVIQKLDL